MVVLPASVSADTGDVSDTVLAHPDVRLVSSSPPVGVLGNCSLGGMLCGHIYNDDNNQNLRITTDWGKRSNSATWRTLKVGQNSKEIGVKDADGFWIPKGCFGKVAFVQKLGPGWYKVYDGQHIHLTDIVC